MDSTTARVRDSGIIVAVSIATLAIGVLGALGQTFSMMLGLVAVGGAVALAALPHVSVAAITFLAFTNAPMVVAGSLGFNNLTETLLVLAIAIAALDYRKWGRFPRLLSFVAFGGLVYVLSLAATAWYAQDPELTLSESISTTKRVLLVVALSAIIRDVKRFRWAIYGVIVGSAILGLFTVIQAVFALQQENFLGFAQVSTAEIADHVDSWRYVGPVNDPNYYAQLLLLGLPLAAIGAIKSSNSGQRAIFVLASGLILTAMLMTVSRGAIVALLAVLVVALRRQRKRLLVATVFLILVGLVAVNFLPDVVVSRFLGVYNDISSVLTGNGFIADKAIAGRLAEMEVAIRLFLDHPMFGVGYNNFDSLYQDVARLNSLMSRGEAREAHNLYLEILAERGLIGFGFFAALISLAIWSASVGARICSAGGHRLEGGFAAALILSLSAYLATSVFLHEAFSASFWVLISLAVAAPQATLSPAMVRPRGNDRKSDISAQGDDAVSVQNAEQRITNNRTRTVVSRTPKKAHPHVSPFDLVATLRRHIIVIVGATIIAGGMGALAPLNSELRYSAEGSLLFRFEREYFPGNVARSGYQGEPIRTLIDGAIQTEIEILGSREVVKGAILRSGFGVSDDMLGQRLPAFLKSLSIRRVEGTQLVRISFEDSSPEAAVRAISALFNSYLDRRATLFKTTPEVVLREAADESREQVKRLRGDLFGIQAQIETQNADGAGPAAAGSTSGAENLLSAQAALQTELDLAEQHYSTIMGLLSAEELAVRVEQSRGPAIKILEPPEANPNPIGLPLATYLAISALIGFAAALFVASVSDWLKVSRANRGINQPR